MASQFTKNSSGLRLWPFGASLLALVLAVAPPSPAFAQFQGGDGVPGASPGAGGAGGPADFGAPTGNGGTGGAGGTNGAGTDGGGPLGGAASTLATAAGGGGAESGGGGGSANNGTGGGGGGGGGRGATLPGGITTLSGTSTGGNGGAGGNAVGPTLTDGGGGGGGGNGAVYSTGTLTINAAVTGGNGGDGGVEGSVDGFGGSGGAGGNGLVVTGAGANIIVNAAITGGNGGMPGRGAEVGAGGIGIIGSGMDVQLASTVSGGVSGSGIQNFALSFTGGSNSLVLNAGFGVSGGINIVGSLQIGQTIANATIARVISGTGSLERIGAGTLTLDAANTYSGGTTLHSGELAIGNMAALGSGDVTFQAGTLRSNIAGTLANNIIVSAGAASHIVAADGQTLTLTGQYAVNAGATALRFGQAAGTGIIDVQVFAGFVGVPGFTVDVLGGTLRGSTDSLSFFTRAATATNVAAGSALEYLVFAAPGVRNLQSAGTVLIGPGVSLLVGGGQSSGVITGGGALTVASPGTFAFGGNTGLLVLSAANTYAGATTIQPGATLQLGAGGTTGSILGNVANSGTLVFSRSNAFQFDGLILGTGGVQQAGTGTTNLTAANTYTGATTVVAGTLLVNGSIATSSGLTVAPGALVGGTGTLPAAVINGTLSPGNSIGTITVAGNLTLGAGSLTVIEVGTAAADRINVTGVANLAGTVRFLRVGQPLAFGTRYTILNAVGGVNGTFASVENLLGVAINPTVTYDPNSAFLTLNAGALAPTLSGLTMNQQSVVAGLDRGIAAGGNATPFLPLFLLPPSAVPAALDQLSGEVHTGTQGLGILVSGHFLQAMLDQNAFGRTQGAALAYGPSGALAGLPGVVAATQAADLPAEVEVTDTRRFAVWASVFGSDGRIGGDAAIGSARRHERNTGIAAGVDVRVFPGTTIGFALAGGGADASVDGRGSLSADVFQAGLYAVTRFGFLDVRAALAYSHLDIDSTRSIPALGIPTLTANYEAEVWSGRLEAAVPLTAFAGLSVAPVAALQVQSARTDAFTETALAGPVAAALTVSGRTQTTSRGELGARFETRFAGAGFDATAFARLAWAHYFERDASINAAFVGLAGSNFTVIGARPDRDSALISAGIDVRVTPQLSIGARFDGEFSETVSQYAGTARIRFEF